MTKVTAASKEAPGSKLNGGRHDTQALVGNDRLVSGALFPARGRRRRHGDLEVLGQRPPRNDHAGAVRALHGPAVLAVDDVPGHHGVILSRGEGNERPLAGKAELLDPVMVAVGHEQVAAGVQGQADRLSQQDAACPPCLAPKARLSPLAVTRIGRSSSPRRPGTAGRRDSDAHGLPDLPPLARQKNFVEVPREKISKPGRRCGRRYRSGRRRRQRRPRARRNAGPHLQHRRGNRARAGAAWETAS